MWSFHRNLQKQKLYIQENVLKPLSSPPQKDFDRSALATWKGILALSSTTWIWRPRGFLSLCQNLFCLSGQLCLCRLYCCILTESSLHCCLTAPWWTSARWPLGRGWSRARRRLRWKHLFSSSSPICHCKPPPIVANWSGSQVIKLGAATADIGGWACRWPSFGIHITTCRSWCQHIQCILYIGGNIYIGSTKPDVSLREAAKEGAAEWEVARAGVAAMQVSPHDTMIQWYDDTNTV